MIELVGLTKRFGSITAVDALTLSVRQGEIFGLVGPDGAGKTTAIRMITGIMEPSAGSIRVLGTAQLEDCKSEIGYVPQKFSLYGDLTVMENIRVIGALYGQTDEVIRQRAQEILSFTKLLTFQDRLADNLSGGMKQKLALAAGLMHQPKLFFLDEPTTGVDPVSRREFWRMLYQLNQKGMSVFVSTPYMDEAELCHRVAFLHQGRLVSCGTPAELKGAYPYKVIELCISGRDLKKRLVHQSIKEINAFGDKYHLIVDNAPAAMAAVERQLGDGVGAVREINPTLEDVFVALASEVS